MIPVIARPPLTRYTAASGGGTALTWKTYYLDQDQAGCDQHWPCAAVSAPRYADGRG